MLDKHHDILTKLLRIVNKYDKIIMYGLCPISLSCRRGGKIYSERLWKK